MAAEVFGVLLAGDLSPDDLLADDFFVDDLLVDALILDDFRISHLPEVDAPNLIETLDDMGSRPASRQ